MAHQVPWDNRILHAFCQTASLTKEEKWILETRINGMSRREQADVLGLSERSVDRRVQMLKRKYDHAQRQSPDLPPRKTRDTWANVQ